MICILVYVCRGTERAQDRREREREREVSPHSLTERKKERKIGVCVCVPRNADEQNKILHVQVHTAKTFQSPADSLPLSFAVPVLVPAAVYCSFSFSQSLSLSLLLFLSGFVIFLYHHLSRSLSAISIELPAVRSFLILASVRGPPMTPVRGPSSPLFGVLPDPCSGSFCHPCAGCLALTHCAVTLGFSESGALLMNLRDLRLRR